MKSNFLLWQEKYGLEVPQLTVSMAAKLQTAQTDQEKHKWTSLLYFLYACGVAAEEDGEPAVKAAIIKQGETSLFTNDKHKLLSEAAVSLALLGEENMKSESDEWKYEAFRITALLLRTPFDVQTFETILGTVERFTRIKSIDHDASYILLSSIHEKTGDPAYQRFFTGLDNELWERLASAALKVMSLFLHDATMEYLVYYELPPGGINDKHLVRCRKMLDVVIECCSIVHQTSPLIKDQFDQEIYQFCSDVITQQNPQPLITYSYRLLDLSSEDFYVTVPKEQISKFIRESIVRFGGGVSA